MQILQQQHSLQSSQMSNKKNSGPIGMKGSSNKRNLQTISAMGGQHQEPSPLIKNSNKKQAAMTRNQNKRMLNKTIEPMTISQASSNMGPFDLMTP